MKHLKAILQYSKKIKLKIACIKTIKNNFKPNTDIDWLTKMEIILVREIPSIESICLLVIGWYPELNR